MKNVTIGPVPISPLIVGKHAMTAEFEQQVQKLQDRLCTLPARSVAVFSAACAERLMMFYEQFTIQNRWDSYPAVRRILDLCWEVLLGYESAVDELKTLSDEFLRLVPHGDDYPGVLCTGAQDCAACIESAIKWIVLAPNARYGVVYYALEVLYAIAMLDRSSAPAADDLDRSANDDYIMSDPAISKELAAQLNDLAKLESSPQVTADAIQLIRTSAIRNRMSFNS